MQRLNGIDASFLYLETPTTHMHVVGTTILDAGSMRGGYAFSKIFDLVEARLDRLPPFRRRIREVPFGLGHPFWIEDPDFDLEKHIHRVALPEPGGERELAELVGHVASVPLDRTRPLWELWVVEGLEHDRVALVTKMHHAAIDGVSGTDIMMQLFDLDPDAPIGDARESTWRPEALPSDLTLFAGAVTRMVSRPTAILGVAVETGRNLIDFAKSALDGGPGLGNAAMPFTGPRTAFNRAVTAHRSVAFGRASLEDVKHVKNTFACTVNDVVLAASTMTLRRYLDAHHDLPTRPLVGTVPISVRTEDQSGTFGNRVSSMFVHLPVQLADPIDQLAMVHADTKDAKRVHKAIGANLLQDWAQFAPPAVFTRASRLYSSMKLAERHRPIHNLVISNVPGPPFPLYVAGARVVAVYPMGPVMEGAGLNITVLSYMGSLDFGVIACRESVPDVQDIADGFAAAVAELRKAAPRTLRAH